MKTVKCIRQSGFLRSLLKRRNFASLMELYESNYELLDRLIPDLDKLPRSVVSHVPGSKDLYLTIIERCKYTTSILLTYYFEVSEQSKIADPDLVIRIYHDTRQAEAMACRRTGFMPAEHGPDNQKPFLDCRWESNIFVQKWLQYSLAQGHRLALETVQCVDVPEVDGLEIIPE